MLTMKPQNLFTCFIWAQLIHRRKKKRRKKPARNTVFSKGKRKKKCRVMRKHISCCGYTRNEPFISFIDDFVFSFYFSIHSLKWFSTSCERKAKKGGKKKKRKKKHQQIAKRLRMHCVDGWHEKNTHVMQVKWMSHISSECLFENVWNVHHTKIWKGIPNKWI